MRALPKLALALLVAPILSVGCATASRNIPTSESRGLAVIVENHAWEDVSVYAASSGGNRRLGSVSSGRTATFQVRNLTGSASALELVAAPLAASNPHRSGRLMVYAGQTVTWTIHENRLGGDVTIR